MFLKINFLHALNSLQTTIIISRDKSPKLPVTNSPREIYENQALYPTKLAQCSFLLRMRSSMSRRGKGCGRMTINE